MILQMKKNIYKVEKQFSARYVDEEEHSVQKIVFPQIYFFIVTLTFL